MSTGRHNVLRVSGGGWRPRGERCSVASFAPTCNLSVCTVACVSVTFVVCARQPLEGRFTKMVSVTPANPTFQQFSLRILFLQEETV